jgi:hypothetical protein
MFAPSGNIGHWSNKPSASTNGVAEPADQASHIAIARERLPARPGRDDETIRGPENGEVEKRIAARVE